MALTIGVGVATTDAAASITPTDYACAWVASAHQGPLLNQHCAIPIAANSTRLLGIPA